MWPGLRTRPTLGPWHYRPMKSNLIACGVAALALALVVFAGCGRRAQRVVLYCAQDREFAERLLADFERETSITVAAKFDTEADKSVSLYVELVHDKSRPRCDVFWNNEILSTLRLQKQGLLTAYESPAATP